MATLVEQNPGEVAGRFSGDVDAVEALFTSGIISMVADACRILSILGVIAVKNTCLALVLLLVLPLLAVFTRHVQKRMLAAQLDHRHAVATVSGQVSETLHNIRTIHALGLEDYIERRYERRIGDSYAAVERTNFYDAVYSPVVLLDAVVVGGGHAALRLRQRRAADPVRDVRGYVGGGHQLYLRIFAPIESLGMGDTDHPVGHGGRSPHRCLSGPAGADIPPEREEARGDVVFSHVTFGYGESHVLTDFSMTVKQGEQVMLVGWTGSRKSTVFKLLLGLYRPEAGTVTIGRWTPQPSGSTAAHLYRLRGAAFFPHTGDRAGADHPVRPADHRRDGQGGRPAGGGSTRPSRRCRRGMTRCVRRGYSLRGVAAAVHCTGRSGRPRCAAAG